MVIADAEGLGDLALRLGRVGEPRPGRRRLELLQVAEALLQRRQFAIRPVRGLEVGLDGRVLGPQQVQQHEDRYRRQGGLVRRQRGVDLGVPFLGQRARAVQGVIVGPVLEGLFPVHEYHLDALCVLKRVARHAHLLPLGCQGGVDAAHRVHDHGAGGGAVNGADEARRFELTVIVGDEVETADVAFGRPGRVAAGDDVDELDRFPLGDGRCRRQVVQLNVPLWERRSDIVHEVFEHGGCAGGAGDAGPEDRRKEGPVMDVEVAVRSWERCQGRVRDVLVGFPGCEEKEQREAYREQGMVEEAPGGRQHGDFRARVRARSLPETRSGVNDGGRTCPAKERREGVDVERIDGAGGWR